MNGDAVGSVVLVAVDDGIVVGEVVTTLVGRGVDEEPTDAVNVNDGDEVLVEPVGLVVSDVENEFVPDEVLLAVSDVVSADVLVVNTLCDPDGKKTVVNTVTVSSALGAIDVVEKIVVVTVMVFVL